MPTDRRAQKIVIAGASSLLGNELKSVLEESRFAGWDLRLVDEEVVAGTLTEAAGEPAIIQRIEEDSFHGARYAFLTGSTLFAKQCLGPATDRRGEDHRFFARNLVRSRRHSLVPTHRSAQRTNGSEKFEPLLRLFRGGHSHSDFGVGPAVGGFAASRGGPVSTRLGSGKGRHRRIGNANIAFAFLPNNRRARFRSASCFQSFALLRLRERP